MTEFIPFHVTLTGSKPEIEEFLPPSYDASAQKSAGPQAVRMKVSISRKIELRPNNPQSEDGASRETTIGEASVVPLGVSDEGEGISKVEYGGQIMVDHENVKTGSFKIKGLSLQVSNF
jgi:hypothetical protein